MTNWDDEVSRLVRDDVVKSFRPEDKAKIKIGCWLTEFGFKVFFEKKDAVSKVTHLPTFSIKGSQRKPDVVFINLPEDLCGVVEMKAGSHGKDIRDSHKIISYLAEHAKGEVSYHIGDQKKRISPTLFLVASDFSREGHLFEKEAIRHHIDAKKATIERRPQKEYDQTFGYIRMLWQLWSDIGRDQRLSLGALLSDALNDGSNPDKPRPAIFVQEFDQKKGRWLQTFRVLGDEYQ